MAHLHPVTLVRGVLIALLALGAPALAQPSDASDVARARQLGAEAAELFRAGKYDEAIKKFHEANRLVPHPNLDVNLGRTYEAMGQPDQALVHCKIALNAPGVPASTREAAQGCVDRATAQLARPVLEINSSPPNAVVRIDGRLMGQTPWRGPVEPGRRQIDLELADHAPVSRTINTERGKEQSLNVTLTAAQVGGMLSITSVPSGAAVTLDGELIGATPIQSFQVDARTYVLEVSLPGHTAQVSTVAVADGKLIERSVTLVPTGGFSEGPRPRWPSWALMGAGVAAAGVGGYFGYSAMDASQEADSLARTSGREEDRGRYDRLVDQMETRALTADILYVTGGLLIAGGLAWLFWPDDAASDRN